MQAFIETLLDTDWGIIALGSFLLIAVLIVFFSNSQTPKT